MTMPATLFDEPSPVESKGEPPPPLSLVGEVFAWVLDDVVELG